MKTEMGQVEEYTVSYQNLLPSTQYQFRLIAYNQYGISYPAVANEKVGIEWEVIDVTVFETLQLWRK